MKLAVFATYWVFALMQRVVAYDLKTIQTLQEPIIKHLANRSLLLPQEFKDKETIFLLEKEKSVIIHPSMLNTASRLVYSPFQIYGPEFNPNIWYEIKVGTIMQYDGPWRPLTGCLNSINGDGGKLSTTFSKVFGTSQTFDLSYAYGLVEGVGISLGTKVSPAIQFTISGSFECVIKANSTGQILIQPSYIEYEKPQIRSIALQDSMAWYNPLVKIASGLVYGEWQVQPNLVTVSSWAKPLLSCISDQSQLMCEEDIIGDSWII